MCLQLEEALAQQQQELRALKETLNERDQQASTHEAFHGACTVHANLANGRDLPCAAPGVARGVMYMVMCM